MFEIGDRVSWDHGHFRYGESAVLIESAAGGRLGTVTAVHDDESWTVELDDGDTVTVGRFELVRVADR